MPSTNYRRVITEISVGRRAERELYLYATGDDLKRYGYKTIGPTRSDLLATGLLERLGLRDNRRPVDPGGQEAADHQHLTGAVRGRLPLDRHRHPVGR